MSWFNILKNEMRSVNLPKFKVKPFNVNKPDEDDNCERKVKEIERRFYARKFFNQSEISSLEEKLKNPDFEVNTNVHKHTDNRRRLTIRYTPKPEKYPNYNQDDSLTISVVVDHETWQTTFGKDSTAQTFADSKLSEEDYCTVLDAIQRDVPFTSKDGAIRYFHTDALTRTANDAVVERLPPAPELPWSSTCTDTMSCPLQPGIALYERPSRPWLITDSSPWNSTAWPDIDPSETLDASA